VQWGAVVAPNSAAEQAPVSHHGLPRRKARSRETRRFSFARCDKPTRRIHSPFECSAQTLGNRRTRISTVTASIAMAYDGRAGRHRIWVSTQNFWGNDSPPFQRRFWKKLDQSCPKLPSAFHLTPHVVEKYLADYARPAPKSPMSSIAASNLPLCSSLATLETPGR